MRVEGGRVRPAVPMSRILKAVALMAAAVTLAIAMLIELMARLLVYLFLGGAL